MANSGVSPECYMNVNLNQRFIKNKISSHLHQPQDNEIEFIDPTCWVLIDGAIKPMPGHVVEIGFEDDIFLRRFVVLNGRPALISDRPNSRPIFLSDQVIIRGVATYVFRPLTT